MERLKRNLTRNMKIARERSGLSMRKLAELVGTTTQSIFLWENGKAFPNEKYIEKLANVLDVDVFWLLGIAPADEEIESWLYEIARADEKKKRIIRNLWDEIKDY